ncbi:MAG: hypothetical protein AAF762_03780 [Pseudomonadota bacterium]
MGVLTRIVFFFGCILVFGAFVIAVDQFATPERKEAFAETTESIGDALAEAPEERTTRRSRRSVSGLFDGAKALANGIFRSAPVVMAEVMPEAPEGWTARDFVETDFALATGETEEAISASDIRHDRFWFNKAARGKSLSAATTYIRGDRVMVMRLFSELDRFRKADAGKPEEKAKMFAIPGAPRGSYVFATLDGLEVHQHPQFRQQSNGRFPVTYRRFTFGIGHVVEGEIFATASDEDVLALLSGIDVAAVQVELDRATDGYEAGAGVAWAGAAEPSNALPGPTTAYRAYSILLEGGRKEHGDYHDLRLIAEGHINDWDGLAKVSKAKYTATPEVISLLGPEPGKYKARRLAVTTLQAEFASLDEPQRRLLTAIAKGKIANQRDLFRHSYGETDFPQPIAEIVAHLPS